MGIGYKIYKRFVDEIISGLDRFFDKDVSLSVVLFGSIARGSGRKDSDIDILVLHKEVGYDPVKRWVNILLELQEGREFKRLIKKGYYPNPSLIFMTPADLSQNPLILLDIMDEGIILKDQKGVIKGVIKTLKERLKAMNAKKIILEDGSWAWDLKPDWKPGERMEIVL